MARQGTVLATLLLAAICLGCLKRGATDVPPAGSPEPVEPPARHTRGTSAEAVPAPAAGESPVPHLLPDPAHDGSQPAVDDLLTRVRELLGALADRTLTGAQREERDAGVAFLAQAEEARDSGEPERAALLADKARILIEDLERATRP